VVRLEQEQRSAGAAAEEAELVARLRSNDERGISQIRRGGFYRSGRESRRPAFRAKEGRSAASASCTLIVKAGVAAALGCSDAGAVVEVDNAVFEATLVN
jgi:hypothetical protein